MVEGKTTQEIVAEFLETMEPRRRIKEHSYVDRKEVYDYEEKIGVKLFDMTPEQISEMFHTFRSYKGGGDGESKLSIASLRLCASYFNALFDFYIDNYETIRNPFSRKLKGMEWLMSYDGDDGKLTNAQLEKAIEDMYKVVELQKAQYIECIIQLFYNGVQSAEEIVALRESDVNEKFGWIKTKRGIVKLPEKAMSLLVRVNKMSSMPGGIHDMEMYSYQESYFKYPVKPSSVDSFNSREPKEIAVIINKYLSKDFSAAAGKKILSKDIFYLGLYNRFVGDFGLQRAESILSGRLSREDSEVFKDFLEQNNIPSYNFTPYKNELKKYF